ncbi:MAG: hypothetical protein ABI794_04870 [Betaproteobacteria bacterium]
MAAAFWLTVVGPLHAEDALAHGRFGLFDASRYRAVDGNCADCSTPRQALWYFRGDLVAVPRVPPVAEDLSSRLPVSKDIAQWVMEGGRETPVEPFMIWLGSPEILTEATLDPTGTSVHTETEGTMTFDVAAKIPANRSYYDAASVAFLSSRSVQVRGRTQVDADGHKHFVARSIWPEDFRLDVSVLPLDPLGAEESLRSLVEADQGGATSPFSARLLWERSPGAARHSADRAVLALMLNGAQGDDDEAHGGHFAIVTGRNHRGGRIDDWLVNNFYDLGAESEKGIIAAMVPLDNYLADLNSGQSWYRPSYLLVAVLKGPRTAVLYQNAVARVYRRFYRHHFEYDHAYENCAGISIDTLDGLGWKIPELGRTSLAKAVGGYFYSSITDLSFASGRKTFDYLTVDQTRLYPRAAFEVAADDLFRLLASPLLAQSEYEQMLAEDVEAIVFVRIPQLPSSRAPGTFPVGTFDEYMARVPADRSQWKIVPVAPREFPDALRDRPAAGPLLSATLVGVLVFGAVIGVIAAPIVAWRWRRSRLRAEVRPP